MVGFQCRDSLFVHNYLIIECLSFLPVLIQQSSGFSVGSLSVPLHVKPLFSWVSLMVSFFWNMIFNQSFYLVLTKFEVSQVQYVLLTNNVCMAPNLHVPYLCRLRYSLPCWQSNVRFSLQKPAPHQTLSANLQFCRLLRIPTETVEVLLGRVLCIVWRSGTVFELPVLSEL